MGPADGTRRASKATFVRNALKNTNSRLLDKKELPKRLSMEYVPLLLGLSSHLLTRFDIGESIVCFMQMMVVSRQLTTTTNPRAYYTLSASLTYSRHTTS